MRLALDADPVRPAVGPRRQRVAAHRGGLARAVDPQRQVLAGERRRERGTAGVGEVDRGHVLAFGDDPGDEQLPEGGPRRACPLDWRDRCGVVGSLAFRGGEQVTEGIAPAGAERRDAQGDPQPGAVVAREVQERVRLGHRQHARAGPGLDDLIAGLDVALGDDAHVEAGPVVADQQGGQFRLAEPQAHPVAGDAGLGDLELGLADAVPVPDADLVVGQAVNGEVLPEMAVVKVVAPEMPRPVPVGVGLVDQDGPLLAAVPGEVALAVAVDVQPADHRRAVHRMLPDSGVHRPPLPGHVLRQADVH